MNNILLGVAITCLLGLIICFFFIVRHSHMMREGLLTVQRTGGKVNRIMSSLGHFQGQTAECRREHARMIEHLDMIESLISDLKLHQVSQGTVSNRANGGKAKNTIKNYPTTPYLSHIKE